MNSMMSRTRNERYQHRGQTQDSLYWNSRKPKRYGYAANYSHRQSSGYKQAQRYNDKKTAIDQYKDQHAEMLLGMGNGAAMPTVMGFSGIRDIINLNGFTTMEAGQPMTIETMESGSESESAVGPVILSLAFIILSVFALIFLARSV